MVSYSRNQDVEIVRVTLVVLFLSLVIVYAAYFQMHWLDWKELSDSTELTTNTGSGNLPDDNALSSLSSFDLIWTGNKKVTISEWGIESVIEGDNTLSALASLWQSGFSINPDLIESASTTWVWDEGDQSEIEATIDGLIEDTIVEVWLSWGANAQSSTVIEWDIAGVNSLIDGLGSELDQVLWWLGTQVNNGWMKILDWTKEFYGDIDALQVLGLTHQYILTDGEAYYAYLGEWNYDFASLARALWGNVVEIVTEIDIVKNGLFGEKIAFVNIPGVTYTTIPVEQRQVVYMIVWWDDDRRLVQVDYASYHRLKPIIAQRFSSFYESN